MTKADPNALLALAAGLRAQGRVREAIAAYEEVLKQNPSLTDSWYNLGLLRRRAGLHEAALGAYDEALARKVAMPEEVHLNRAIILSDDLRRPDEARRDLVAALQLNPAYVPAMLNLGNLAEDLGQVDEAISAYERVLAIQPHHAVALSRLSGMGALWAGHDSAMTRLRKALSGESTSAGDRATLLFALAQRLDASGQFEAAFDKASEARAASGASSVRYDRSAMERRVARQRETFTTAEPASPIRHALEPVFIVGMFRSGSTLMEQILSAHESVRSAGELPLVPKIAGLLRPYPMIVAGAARAQLDRLAGAYIAELDKMSLVAGVVTDKRPDNFEHVGLIKRMFPNARILYMRRHPLDICVSTHFLHVDSSLSWASSPPDIAHQIIQCTLLMEHWTHLYPNDILTVDYERLLEEPEGQIREVLSFLGLPWSPACLAFHTSRSQVRTASVWQVREPLHRRSVARWRNYEKKLEGATAMLRSAGLIDR